MTAHRIQGSLVSFWKRNSKGFEDKNQQGGPLFTMSHGQSGPLFRKASNYDSQGHKKASYMRRRGVGGGKEGQRGGEETTPDV